MMNEIYAFLWHFITKRIFLFIQILCHSLHLKCSRKMLVVKLIQKEKFWLEKCDCGCAKKYLYILLCINCPTFFVQNSLTLGMYLFFKKIIISKDYIFEVYNDAIQLAIHIILVVTTYKMSRCLSNRTLFPKQ